MFSFQANTTGDPKLLVSLVPPYLLSHRLGLYAGFRRGIFWQESWYAGLTIRCRDLLRTQVALRETTAKNSHTEARADGQKKVYESPNLETFNHPQKMSKG